MSVNGWMDEEYEVCIYLYTMDSYSAAKKNEILPFATTWMDIQDVMLSEVSLTEKDISMPSLTCPIKHHHK